MAEPFETISAELAQAQRGLPERAMLRIQHSQIAQLYGFAAEHVGDITNRMAEDVQFFKGNYLDVGEKVRKSLRVLRDRYGFEKEFMQQIESNLPFLKKSKDLESFDSASDALARLKELGQVYADEHKNLVVANEAQRTARDAAVAIGEFRFKDAIKNLEILEAELSKGREAWDLFALQGLEVKPPAVAGEKQNPGDERLLKVAIEREPLRVAKQWGYEVHRLSPTDIVDKEDYARGYRYRLSKADPTQPYPRIVMARNEGEVATYLKRQIEGGNPSGNPDNGTCYEDAWRYIIKQEEGKLIHGTVLSRDRRIGHAWVDLPSGYIWEPETGKYFTREAFNIAASPIEEHRYTVEEAAIMLARVGKHGPWTKEEKQRFLKGGNPMPKTESERLSFHERIFGKGAVPPLTTLKRGMAVNKMLPMPPESGPPLPRALGLRWPWLT